jgi:hypothetical protein
MCFALDGWWLSDRHDIAVGRLRESVPGAEPMTIANEHLPVNADAIAVEYSQSSWHVTKDERREFRIRTSRRKGNVV